ncbi:hypothetical protein GCM10027067_12220 [Pseudactinotalea suaedae]
MSLSTEDLARITNIIPNGTVGDRGMSSPCQRCKLSAGRTAERFTIDRDRTAPRYHGLRLRVGVAVVAEILARPV